MKATAGLPVGLRVRAYLDSHRKVFSLKYRGRVVAKAVDLSLVDVRFVVSEAGRARVRATGRKTPHAYVEGVVTAEAVTADRPFTYSPFKADGFTESNGSVLRTASEVRLRVLDGKPVCTAAT